MIGRNIFPDQWLVQVGSLHPDGTVHTAHVLWHGHCKLGYTAWCHIRPQWKLLRPLHRGPGIACYEENFINRLYFTGFIPKTCPGSVRKMDDAATAAFISDVPKSIPIAATKVNDATDDFWSKDDKIAILFGIRNFPHSLPPPHTPKKIWKKTKIQLYQFSRRCKLQELAGEGRRGLFS